VTDLLIRALLQCERRGYGADNGACGGCDYDQIDTKGHQTGCLVDLALTAAGLPDKASRDEFRNRYDER
jgi:hypothetical protein